MFKEIPDLLTAPEIQELRRLAAGAQFVDGRITNPHSTVKNNLQLHEPQSYQQSSQLLLRAFQRHPDFNAFALPVQIAPPLMTRYQPGMHYGRHPDNAFIGLPTGPLRSDISCTIFINDPESYEGGALAIHLGTRTLKFKGAAGSAIIYPSDTLHEVEAVTSGERLVAITFIQSRVKDPWQRYLLYELNEVAALEGLKMDKENWARMQLIQQNLMRYWSDKP